MNSSLLREALWNFDPVLIRHIDLFHVQMLEAAENSLLPELYQLLGPEQVALLIERFAGTTIKIPGKEAFKEAARNTEIYLRSRSGESSTSLQRKYHLTRRELDAIITRMQWYAKKCPRKKIPKTSV